MLEDIDTRVMYPESDFLLLVETTRPDVPAATWAARHREFLKAALLRHGGVLLRGFAGDRYEFSATAKALEPEALDYRGGIGPRNLVAPEVYNSTELPPAQGLAQHHEMAYNSYWPRQILFFCEVPPESGGATTLCDARKFYARLPAALRDRLEASGLQYIRNHTPSSPFRSLAETFGTEDQARISAFCRDNGIEAVWNGEQRLTMIQRAPAVRRHPETGDPVFFNTLVLWHHSYWSKTIGVYGGAAQGEIWQDSLHGDGTPIEDSVVAEILARYEEEEVQIAWQAGDIVYFDNMLVSHGRRPFAGKRKILASFRSPYHAARAAEGA